MNVESLDKDLLYDVLIIGGGPAGLNAALYAKRKGLDVGLISERSGGQIMDTSTVENYLGYTSISGIELAEEFKKHVDSLEVPTENKAVTSLNLEDTIKEVSLEDNSVYRAKSIIIATGSKPRKLGVEGEKDYSGRGVTYCAICDGPLFMDQDVIVAGGGNSAVEAVIDLAKIANSVTLVHRSQLRADKVLIDEMEKLNNVEVKLETQIVKISGEMLMNKVDVIDKKKDESYKIKAGGLFVEIGYIPNTSLFEDLVELNDKSEIIVDKHGRTNIAGVFAAGDVTEMPYKQIVMAAGEGAKCALAVNDYLKTLKVESLAKNK